MSSKLVWNSGSSSGAFKFADGILHLLVADDYLDRMSTSPSPRDGVSIELQDNGLYSFNVHGDCYLIHDDAEVTSIELSARSPITLASDDCEIELLIEAQGIVANDPLVGTTIGGHRIIERLGQGGVGIVYRAEQIDLQREVALKVLSQTAVDRGQAAIDAFKREAIAAGRMSHPNLVQVYSVGEDNGVNFFGMEIVEAGDAEQHLKNFGPFSEEQAVDIICQVAEALQYAATNHLVHRDIKPENLMFTSDGRVKLADLGMSSTRELAADSGIGGTPHFMAPEAVANASEVDHRSDFYSLGCTFFRLLTNRTPFSGNSVSEILLQHRDADIPLLSTYAEGVSKGAQELLEWLMAKKQDERPQSSAQIIEFCESLLERPRRSPIALILAVVAASAAIIFFASNSEPVGQSTEKIIVDDSAVARNQELQEELDRLRREAEEQAARTEENNAAEVQETSTNLPQEDLNSQLYLDLKRDSQSLVNNNSITEAIILVDSSSLSDDQKDELLNSCYAIFDSKIERLRNEHSLLLAENKFAEAEQLVSALAKQLNASRNYPFPWLEQITELNANRLLAKTTFLEKTNLDKRKRFRLSHFSNVCAPLLDFNVSGAQSGMQQILSADAPPQYSASANAYRHLFAEASAAKEKLFQLLASAGDLRISDPIDQRRAIVSNATDSGIAILLQVRGERVPRTDSWSTYTQPKQWFQLLSDLSVDISQSADFQNLSLLLATSQTAQLLRSAPTASAADIAQSHNIVDSWLNELQQYSFNSVASTEYSALLQARSILQHIDQGNNYSALQLLDLFMQRFSLLATWSTNGDKAFSTDE